MAVNIPFCEEKSWNKCFLSMWEAFVNPFHFVRQVPVEGSTHFNDVGARFG